MPTSASGSFGSARELRRAAVAPYAFTRSHFSTKQTTRLARSMRRFAELCFFPRRAVHRRGDATRHTISRGDKRRIYLVDISLGHAGASVSQESSDSRDRQPNILGGGREGVS